MHWLKRDLWKTGITIAGMLLLLVFMVWVPVSAADAPERASGFAGSVTVKAQATPTEDATVTALNKEKLEQEVQQLKNQNDRSIVAWFWNSGGFLGTVVAALLAAAGVFATVGFNFQQWLENQKDTRAKELEERLKERFESLKSAIVGLADEKVETRVNAVIMLRTTFLRPGYEQFYEQIFKLAVAHLQLRKADTDKAGNPPASSENSTPGQRDVQGQRGNDTHATPPADAFGQVLVELFRESFPLARSQIKGLKPESACQALDARKIQLARAYLHDADLKQAFLPQAYLYNANLTGAYLTDADLFGAHLDYAHFKWAHLEHAILEGAWLTRANLTRANLTRANLTDANLEYANLTYANLTKACPENAASLKGAKMYHVIGLSSEQRIACQAKGAIIDEGSTISSSQSNASASPPSQSDDVQIPLAPSAEGNEPTPDADGNSAAPSKPDQES